MHDPYPRRTGRPHSMLYPPLFQDCILTQSSSSVSWTIRCKISARDSLEGDKKTACQLSPLSLDSYRTGTARLPKTPLLVVFLFNILSAPNRTCYLEPILKFSPRSMCRMDLLLPMASTKVTMSQSKPVGTKPIVATTEQGQKNCRARHAGECHVC